MHSHTSKWPEWAADIAMIALIPLAAVGFVVLREAMVGVLAIGGLGWAVHHFRHYGKKSS